MPSEDQPSAVAAPPRDSGPPSSPELERIYLLPGRHVVAEKPTLVTTVLGSCVSACLWDDVRGIGGVNHYLFPAGDADGVEGDRFANSAIAVLLDGLLGLGAIRSRLKAKIFGGARVLGPARGVGSDLGSRNAKAATTILERLGIPVVASDVGGERGRKLVFRTDEGSAWVRKL